MEDIKHKFYLTASIKTEKETEELKKEAASVIKLPTDVDKQPDLQYFSAIFVSSGENLNHAYFLGSELVSASDTVISKALDIEHEEQEIIGHLYSSAFTDDKGTLLDLVELASTETASLDAKDMHIQIGAIVYKNRFPEIAKEIVEDEWKVSMECYYTDFDVKVGNVILPKAAAQAVGIEVSDDSLYGKKASIVKDGKEIATGTLARVLRGICFSGCGIVKSPANPPSVILETAKEETKSDVLVINLDPSKKEISDNKKEIINVTSKDIEEENSDLTYNDGIGICLNFKRRVEDKDGNIINENWCSEYSQTCTSFSRDVLDQDCLKNKIKMTTASYIEALFNDKRSVGKTADLLKRLQSILDKAKKLVE
ncbi:MAG: hypothetical protein KAH05_08915 [Clostridiales bacterium]|nr:hypothetical protein [Clostridiales bacterium]